jgi:hypothetical protein
MGGLIRLISDSGLLDSEQVFLCKQETLLNLLLRNYLHYNLYERAEKLRAKTHRPETSSNQQVGFSGLWFLRLSDGNFFVLGRQGVFKRALIKLGLEKLRVLVIRLHARLPAPWSYLSVPLFFDGGRTLCCIAA